MMSPTVSLEALPSDSGSLSSKDFAAIRPTNSSAEILLKDDIVRVPQGSLASSSARDIAIKAAKSTASQGVAHAKTGLAEVQKYVQMNPDSVRAISFCIALALLVFSVLGVVNIFEAIFQPHQYLFAFYNIVFAAVIVVADAKPEWSCRLQHAQERLFSAASFLAWQRGRAAFYFYVGSINLCMLPDNFLWKAIYLGMGGALCFNGTLMLLDNSCCRQHQNLEQFEVENP